jgi:oligopeptide/dipeptide ABC transporter ATP-binding protein
MSPSPLLQLSDVRVHFPSDGGAVVRAVDGVSLAVHSGETLGLVGESGCGKSTLSRAALRLERVTAGRVHAFGEDITDVSERALRPFRRRIGVVFQDPYTSLNPRMRVGEAVAEPMRIHRAADAAERESRARALLAQVGLPEGVGARLPHELSGGQLQRVGIARALALDPELVVADEPLSALDVSVQAGILNLLMDLREARGLAFLFVAHDLEVVRLFCHRVAVMYLGRVVEEGASGPLYDAPAHPYTRALLASAPVPDPRRRSEPPALQGEVPSPIDPPNGCAFHPRCALAEPACRTVRPELSEVGPEHRAACPVVGRGPAG